MRPEEIVRKCTQVIDAIARHTAEIADQMDRLHFLQEECRKIGHEEGENLGQGQDGSPAYRCRRCGAEYEK